MKEGNDPPGETEPPHLADESRWYTEHTGPSSSARASGRCSALDASSRRVGRGLGGFPPYYLLPLALPACVWLIRSFAPTAREHGTEAVIAAVHQASGRVAWKVAPSSSLATC